MIASMIPSKLTPSNVSLATTGYFTCTATGRDIPIKEDYDAKHVTIAVPPDDPPTITEVPAHFSPEDILSLNCSTFNSPVSPHLRWILNHQEVTKWAMELNLFSSSNLPLSSILVQLDQGHLAKVRLFFNLK